MLDAECNLAETIIEMIPVVLSHLRSAGKEQMFLIFNSSSVHISVSMKKLLS